MELFTLIAIVIIVAGLCFYKYRENYIDELRHMQFELKVLRDRCDYMKEQYEAANCTVVEYADMGPAAHMYVAKNMLVVERTTMSAEAFNTELRLARKMASKIMRTHMEPEECSL